MAYSLLHSPNLQQYHNQHNHETQFEFGDIHSDFLRDSSTFDDSAEYHSIISDGRRKSSEIENFGNDKYKVVLNVKERNLEQLMVKVIDSNCIKIEGQHSPNPTTDSAALNEKSDECKTSSSSEDPEENHFEQSYILPDDAEVKYIKCNLSEDGIFTIVTPRRYSFPEGVGLKDFPSFQI